MKSTERFSKKADIYDQYRPKYPLTLKKYITEEYINIADMVIADIGAGTGISTELVINNKEIYAVEPNDDMRSIAESKFKLFSGYRSICGTAEETTLSNKSIDVILCGQAIHWFDVNLTKKEFLRICKKNASLLLFWNVRNNYSNDFLIELESYLYRYAVDYKKVRYHNLNTCNVLDDEKISVYFKNSIYTKKAFKNSQKLDFEAFKGRIMSYSFMNFSSVKDERHALTELKTLFLKYESNNTVELLYDTVIYGGICG